MNFACEVECRALVRALKLVTPTIQRRNSVPVLSTVCLTAKKSTLKVEGTDLDHTVSVDVRVAGNGRGAVCVGAKRLLGVLKMLPPGETISLATTDAGLDIGTAAGFLTIYGTIPENDFPEMDPPGEDSRGVLTANFAPSLARVKPFISKEPTRYCLNGVYLHGIEGRLSLVTTDGHRMAIAHDCGDASFLPKGAIVPTVAVGAYLRLFGNDDAVRVRNIAGSWMEFRSGGRRLITKLIDGTYPDYGRVIPGATTASVTVDRIALDRLAALALAVNTTAAAYSRNIILSVQHGKLVLDTRHPDCGSMIAPLPILRSEGDFPAVAFNSWYLREMISAAGGDDFTIRTTGSYELARIDADGVTLVLMPMRSNEARPLPVRQHLEAAE